MYVHPANIGPQFWSRDNSYPGDTYVSHDFGVVDADDPTKAAFVSMNRNLDIHANYGIHDDYGAEWEKDHGQGRLFGSQQATGWQVDGLFAHEDMRHTVPSLLGLAAIHSLKTTKKVPDATSDLSNASKRVVDRLVEAKLLRDPLKGKRRDFEPNDTTSAEGGWLANAMQMGTYIGDVALPTSDSDHASNAVRSALRASTAAKNKKKAIANRPRPHTPPGWGTPGLFEAESYTVEKPKKPKGAKRA